MLSQEAMGYIEMLRQSKEATKGIVMTEEMAHNVRELNDQLTSTFPIPEQITVEETAIAGIKGEFYHYNDTDAEKQKGRFLLYMHGGGFENGTVKSRRYIATWIAANAKVDAFSVDYTQWPEGRHPVALNECVAAFHGIEAMGYPAESIYVAGDSAGAVLTLSLTLWLKEHGEALPGKLVAVGPVMDHAVEYPSRRGNDARDPMLAADINDQLRAHYFEGHDPKSPFISPRYGNYVGFPETLITVGTEEILYDDAVDLHRILDQAGVKNELKIYEGLYHTFQTVHFPESVASLREIGDFLR